ncbi:MAG: hypothetical protein HOH74_18895 [Gemmatimonadetes bacterium]|jgi:D-alanyl-lipoteichoic acid acyltransferase DltB (MBOAT superfamily)|nr:hypothetical protein [Gemmatimonadota bacterium]
MVPSFVTFVNRELGGARSLSAVLGRIFLRPFLAPSFAGFWREWNPAYRYLLWFYVYAPLKRVIAPKLAAYLTFVICGLLLHDVPFLHGRDWLRGRGGFPAGTLLFSVFGLLSLLTEELRLNLSRRSAGFRVVCNLGWILLSFVIYWFIRVFFEKHT